jgi:hypothetical protein
MVVSRARFFSSVLLLSFVAAGLAASQVEGGQVAGERVKLERFLTKLKNDAGLPVKRVTCERYSEMVRTQLRWQCRIVYKYGPSERVWTTKMVRGGPFEMWYDDRPPPAGAWYRDCLKSETKRYCRRIGRRQIRACMDRPSDYRLCREIVYGHALKPKTGSG